MIAVKDIITEVRLGVKDFNKKAYSDYEVITHVNKSLRMICNYLSQRNNDFTERSVLICDTPIAKHFIEEIAINIDKRLHGDRLPEDFLSVVKVVRPDGYVLHPSTGAINQFNYMIYRDCLLTKGPVILTYRRSVPMVDTDGFIDFPFSFFDFIAECVKISLTKGADELSKYITDNAIKMLPARKYSNARVKLPWRV